MHAWPMQIRINEEITLSQVTLADVPQLVTYMQAREIHASVANLPDPYTRKEAEFWVKYVEQVRQESGRLNNWAIRDAQGQLIGGIGFRDHMPPGARVGDFGYWLGKPFWGQGIMSEVVGRFCEFGLGTYGLKKIEAKVFPENQASAQVLRKNDFEWVERLERHIEVQGTWRDVDVYEKKREFSLENLKRALVVFTRKSFKSFLP
jgi:ribosomal-protein-alanine N-acetyltransferase